MKHKMISNSYSSPEIEELITNFSTETIAVCRGYAIEDAQKTISETLWRTRVFNFVESKAKAFMANVQSILHPSTTALTLKTQEATFEQKRQRFHGKITELEIETEVSTQILKTINANHLKYWTYWIVFSLGLLFGAFDGLLAFESIYATGIGLMQAIATGVIITLVTGLGAHFGAGWTMTASTKHKRNQRLIIQIAAAACMFSLLGVLRAQYINSDIDIRPDAVETINSSHVSGCTIAGISLLIFCTSLFFSLCSWLTPAEKEQIRLFRKKQKELNRLVESMRGYQKELAEIETANAVEIQSTHQVCEYALASRKRILAISNECLSVYANTYLNYSTHGHCPDFFSNPPEFNI